MNNRREIEESIIGIVLQENCFASVVNILQAKNFSDKYLSTVWNVIAHLWPTKPLDLLTVTHEMDLLNQEPNAHKLARYTLKSCSSAHLVYWAFILLEIDIKEKFLLRLWHHKSKEEDFSNKGVIQDVINHFSQIDSDLFDSVQASLKYFKAHRLELIYEDLKELAEQVDQRAGRIKKTYMLETARREVQKLEKSINDLNKET